MFCERIHLSRYNLDLGFFVFYPVQIRIYVFTLSITTSIAKLFSPKKCIKRIKQYPSYILLRTPTSQRCVLHFFLITSTMLGKWCSAQYNPTIKFTIFIVYRICQAIFVLTKFVGNIHHYRRLVN
jgi:hypothetical protein